MKLISKILGILIITGTVACKKDQVNANQSAVSSNLEETFRKQNPEAKEVEWSKEGEYFEVEFEADGIEKEIVYDAEGNIIETETAIAVSELSSTITTYISENYNGYNIEEAEKVENSKGVFYEVELENNDTEVELLFDNSGNFVEEEIEDEDDDEEDGDDENEREINPEDLSEGIKNAIQADYPNAELLEADEVTQKDGKITYDVEIKYNNEVIELMYDTDANFLGIETDDEDNDSADD